MPAPLRAAATTAALALFAACSDAGGPTTNLQVNNTADDFSFVAQTFERSVNDSLRYNWQHSGTVAEVTQTTRVAAGSATVTIWDAGGTQVYTHDLAESGKFLTSTGVSGTWSVQVVFRGLNGDIILEVKKT